MSDSVFTTIKVTKRVKRLFHGFKARLMARRKRRVSDTEAIAEVLREAQAKNPPEEKAAVETAWDMTGFIKGGKRFNAAKETDKIVYGV